MSLCRSLPFTLFALLGPDLPALPAATWTIERGPNVDSPGEMVAMKKDGQWVARLVFGPGQMKPFLHVYGRNQELLTNGGLNQDGKPTGAFPHHRGIFIGWRVQSDLGSWDLWHMNRGGGIRVSKVRTMEADAAGCRLVLETEWVTGKTKEGETQLLMREVRHLRISQPADGQTQVDATFVLTPVRDVKLAGDLQHSGIHFRASNEVNQRKNETAYLMEPDGKVKGLDLRWCRFLFPIGDQWYTALLLNAPGNPVEQLSTRNYGRFGYFFKRDLPKDETLKLNYRFVVSSVEKPADEARQSPAQLSHSRKDCQEQYEAFVKELADK